MLKINLKKQVKLMVSFLINQKKKTTTTLDTQHLKMAEEVKECNDSVSHTLLHAGEMFSSDWLDLLRAVGSRRG